MRGAGACRHRPDSARNRLALLKPVEEATTGSMIDGGREARHQGGDHARRAYRAGVALELSGSANLVHPAARTGPGACGSGTRISPVRTGPAVRPGCGASSTGTSRGSRSASPAGAPIRSAIANCSRRFMMASRRWIDKINVMAACSVMNTEDKFLTGESRKHINMIDIMTDHYVSLPRLIRCAGSGKARHHQRRDRDLGRALAGARSTVHDTVSLQRPAIHQPLHARHALAADRGGQDSRPQRSSRAS